MIVAPDSGTLSSGAVSAKQAGAGSFRSGWESLLASLGDGIEDHPGGPRDVEKARIVPGAMGKGPDSHARGAVAGTAAKWARSDKAQSLRRNAQEPNSAGSGADVPDLANRRLSPKLTADPTETATVSDGRPADQIDGDAMDAAEAKKPGNGSAHHGKDVALQQKGKPANAQSPLAAAVAASQTYIPTVLIGSRIDFVPGNARPVGVPNAAGDPMGYGLERPDLEQHAAEKSAVGQSPGGRQAIAAGTASAEASPAEGFEGQSFAISGGWTEPGTAVQAAWKGSLHQAQASETVPGVHSGARGTSSPVAVLKAQGALAESKFADVTNSPGELASADVTAAASIAESAPRRAEQTAREASPTTATEQAVAPGKANWAEGGAPGWKDQAVGAGSSNAGRSNVAAVHPDSPVSEAASGKQPGTADRLARDVRPPMGTHLGEIHAAEAQPAVAPATFLHPAQTHSGAAAPEGASGQGSLAAAAASPGTGRTDPDAFSALDAESAPPSATWTHMTTHRAEAGFQDPSLGWVSVRADAGADGIHASVVASSADAAQALSGHLAGLGMHLAEQHTPVHTLTLTSPGGGSPDAGTDQGSNRNMQQGGGQDGHTNRRAEGGLEAVPLRRTGGTTAHFTAETAEAPGWAAIPGRGRISVVA